MLIPIQELEFVDAFVLPALRERWKHMLSSPKKRLKQLHRLYHGFDFQAQSIELCRHHAAKQEQFISLLRQRGAGGDVYVISARSELDAKTFSFAEASKLEDGCAWNTASVCIYKPRSLVVFSDEYDRHVLYNPAA